MKKLLVLIVLLVFGLSFLGASSSFGQPKEVSKIEYYLVDPLAPDEKDCYVEVYTSPNFKLRKVGGNCIGIIPDKPEPIKSVTINKASVDPKHIDFQGWYYYHASPGHYCYVHPVTKEYQCIYWAQ
jgi:hypothetical protein